MYFSGQGKLFVAGLTDGVPGIFRWLGNVPDFGPKFKVTKLDHKDSYSGQRLLDLSLITENQSSISATVEDWSPENLALATRGTVSSTVSGSVTNELSPADLAVGEIWALRNVSVTALVITDSTSGTPVTINPNLYTIDAAYGTVVLKPNALTGVTLPLKAAYTKGVVDIIAFFTQGSPEIALRFEGMNTADGNKKVLVELYRVSVDPAQEVGLITEKLGQLKLEGNVLIDSTKPDDLAFGKFGRMIYL